MANRYWVGGTGNWAVGDTAHWSTASGGASGASVPSVADDVIFDANSFSANGQTVTVQAAKSCKGLDFSGVSYTVTITPTDLTVAGNLVGSALVATATSGYINMRPGNNDTTLLGNGMTFYQLLVGSGASGYGGSVTLLGNLICNLFLVGNDESFYANNFNIESQSVTLGSGEAIVDMGSGEWRMKPLVDGGAFAISGNVSLVCGTSTIVFDFSSFAGTGMALAATSTDYTFYNVSVEGAAKGIVMTFNTSNGTFNDISITGAPITIHWVKAKTQTMQTLEAVGSVGSLITFRSTTDGQEASLSATTTTISYVDVKDNHALGAGIPFEDYPGGVDSLNNTNWCFTGGCRNSFLQNTFLVGADPSGDVQMLNIGKSDDSVPIYYELETQELEFGDRGHLKKIADNIGVLTTDGLDSSLSVKSDTQDYQPVPVDLSTRVAIGDNIDAEGHYFTFKWHGEVDASSPIFEGLYLQNVTDLGITQS